MASAVPPFQTALHEQVSNSSPPRILYRAFYDKCATRFDETGIHARRADFDISQLSDSALQSAIGDHLNWKCRKPSPFISLLSDYLNMRKWAQHMAFLPFRRGDPIHVFQIDTSVAQQTRFFKPAGGGRNEWFAVGHIPANAIRPLATVSVSLDHTVCWVDEPLLTQVGLQEPQLICEGEPVAPAFRPNGEPPAVAPAFRPTHELEPAAPAFRPNREPPAVVPAVVPAVAPASRLNGRSQAVVPASQPTCEPQAVVSASRPTREPRETVPASRPNRQPQAVAPASRANRQPQAVVLASRPTRQPRAVALAFRPDREPQTVVPAQGTAHQQDTVPAAEPDLPMAETLLIISVLMVVWHLLYAIQLILEALYI